MSDTPRSSTDGGPARPTLDDARVRVGLDHEHRLLSEAILLVSSGGSPRVTVAGLNYPEAVLEASRAFATARHVRLVPLWTDDEGGADVAVEPLGDGSR